MDGIYNINGAGGQRNAFVAGAVSVSLIWWLSSALKKNKLDSNTGSGRIKFSPDLCYEDDKDKDKDEDNKNNKNYKEEDGHKDEIDDYESGNESFYNPWKSKIEENYSIIDKILRQSMMDFPSKLRERWPWESLRKFPKTTGNDDDDNDDNDDHHHNEEQNQSNQSIHGRMGRELSDEDLIHSNNVSMDEKSDTCIGSIFGLDVGGTLSKLLYFEEKQQDSPQAQQRKTMLDPLASYESYDKVMSLRSDIGSSAPTLFPFDIQDDKDDISHSYHQTHLKHESSSGNESNRSENFTIDEDDEEIHILVKMHELNSPTQSTKINRSYSMFNISSKEAEREQALQRFYAFVREIDTFDETRSLYSRSLGGEFHFIQFETQYIAKAMDLIRLNNLHLNINQIGATGGGAHKYSDKWDKELGITIDKQDELDSLVAGMQFVLADVVGECYTFKPNRAAFEAEMKTKAKQDSATESQSNDNVDVKGSTTSDSNDNDEVKDPVPPSPDRTKPPDTTKKIHGLDQYWWSRKVKRDFVAKSDSYPYLLVVIGTGVSVIRVDGPRKHERISGSTIGGGTYWGLCRLLTDAEDFENVLNLAERGDPSKVDMMVGDIYGNNSDALEKLGLTADIVASSFGKLATKQHPARGLTQEDLARALLLMVTNNIGQVGYLNAKLHNTERIYFVGNFLRENVLSQKRLAYAINYWSKGKMEALFLEHEGYFGALGAFLLHQGIQQPQHDKQSEQTKSEGNTNRQRCSSF